MKSNSKRRQRNEAFDAPVYHRSSRRGGNGGKREITVTSVSRGYDCRRRREQRVPYIRMSGAWLQRLGFQSGHRIEITAERERLVLTLVPDQRKPSIN